MRARDVYCLLGSCTFCELAYDDRIAKVTDMRRACEQRNRARRTTLFSSPRAKRKSVNLDAAVWRETRWETAPYGARNIAKSNEIVKSMHRWVSIRESSGSHVNDVSSSSGGFRNPLSAVLFYDEQEFCLQFTYYTLETRLWSRTHLFCELSFVRPVKFTSVSRVTSSSSH